MNVDESFTMSHKNKSLYVDAISEAKKFINTYNDTLSVRVHKSFWKDYYFYNQNNFAIDIIFSQRDITLIYIEQNNSNIDLYNIYYTHDNPQLFIQELKNKRPLYIRHPISYAYAFSIPQNGERIFIYNVAFKGPPVPFEINKNSTIATFNYTVTSLNEIDSMTTRLPGISILIGSDDSKRFRNQIEYYANNILDIETKDKYKNSEIFRKALIHPKLREIALEIRARIDKADNKITEYPRWEFEDDLNKMRKLAKENNISDNYVDEMFKDNQYYPISGTLLFYYSNQLQFMGQWTLVNIALIIITTLLMRNKSIMNNLSKEKIFTIIILPVNAWIFYKKPDSIGFLYWIIPGLSLLVAYLFLFLTPRERPR
jgi:hypothetical protein